MGHIYVPIINGGQPCFAAQRPTLRVGARATHQQHYATQKGFIRKKPLPSRGGEESLRVEGMVRQSVSQITASEARRGRMPGASCSNSSSRWAALGSAIASS